MQGPGAGIGVSHWSSSKEASGALKGLGGGELLGIWDRRGDEFGLKRIILAAGRRAKSRRQDVVKSVANVQDLRR